MTSLKYIFLALSMVYVQSFETPKGFDGFQLISVFPQSARHVALLERLQFRYAEMDFWQHPMVNMSCSIIIPSYLSGILGRQFNEEGIKWNIITSDISRLIENTNETPFVLFSSDSHVDFHKQYHGYDEIIKYLEELEHLYPDNMEISYLPHLTHENRSVVYAKLKGKPSDSPKRAIMVEAGIHAREWVSPAASMFVVERLLEGYVSGSEEEQFMLDKYDWYFIPVTNPDGYSYSRLSSRTRLWRKNRRPISRRCIGIDLNRNFDIYHGYGISSNCRSVIYPGRRAFSEPETANIRDFFHTLKDSVIAYLSVHSYAQFILVPWFYSSRNRKPANAVEIERVARLMSKAMESTHGVKYRDGTPYRLLGRAATGTSVDWALYTKSGIYSMAFELRPSHQNTKVGFLLPPREIIPTGEELLASLKVLAKEMKN